MTNNTSSIPTKITPTPNDWVETTLGFIPKDWKIIPANEFCEKVADGTHDSPKQSEDGKLLITSKNLKDGQLDISSAYLISLKDFEEVNKRSKVDKWDILLSMIGTVGEVCLISDEPYFAIKNVGLFKCGNESNAKWLYYFLRSSIGQNHLLSRLSGTTQKYITLGELRNFPIIIPRDLAQQKAIASVLSSFDDKIELLREQNKTLEEIGQTIFKEWFGKYGVDDLDELPECWRVGKLGEVGQIVCGKTPSKENKEYFGGEIPFIKIPDMHGEVFIVKTEDSLTELGANTQKNKFIPKNAICVSCIATVGLVTITSKDSQTNQQINSIVPNDQKYLEYLYFVLTNMKSDLLAIGSGGSATLNINTSTFSNIEIMIPNQEVLENFHNATNPIFTKILDNLYQIQSLTHSRDELLPKLMSGQVRVKL
jgi:type I restriction enzyme S subunit